jgi:hypothetical protein
MSEASLLIESRGWWEMLIELDFPDDFRLSFPYAYDRFIEAMHFIELVNRLEPSESNLSQANWYGGAHLEATVGVREAAQADFRARGLPKFKYSSVAREFFLSPDADVSVDRDPVGVNRAYRELRNLRTHFGTSVLRFDNPILAEDLFSTAGQACVGRWRWFFALLTAPSVEHLKEPMLSSEQRDRFNSHVRLCPFPAVASQHLYILGRALLDTWKELTG